MQNAKPTPLPLLIDTHYWIWLEGGIDGRIAKPSLQIIEKAAAENNLFLSVISVWEVALLESKKRLQLSKPSRQWVEDSLSQPGITIAPLTPAIAIESNHLPGTFHGDPADRIIVATARIMGARLLTSDKSIRAYGEQRHVLLA
jgi:PIN domain nuclease of toxin-antitoxin system